MPNKKIEITPEQVKHIANLAMLKIHDNEIPKFQKQLTSILNYITKIEDVDTEKIAYKSQTDLKNVFREDVLKQSLSQQAALSNRSEAVKKKYFPINSVLPTDE